MAGNDMTVTKVGAACLDVYEEEGDLFYEDCSEEIVASHQAFLTKEARGEPSPETEVCYHCAREETCRKERNQKCF